MKNWIKFPAIALLIVVLLGLVLWMNRECSAPAGQQAIETMHALGCADYWFGRYQALIGLILVIPALASVRRLLARHLAIGARDRALMMQEVWIRRSRELTGASNIAVDTMRLGAEITNAAPAIAKTDSNQDIDAHSDAAAKWLTHLSILEGKADEASAGFVGGPKISGSLHAMAGAIAAIRQRMHGELQVLSVSTPPRRYAGSSVVEGQEVFLKAAQEFGACGREIAEAGKTMQAQIEEERSRIRQLLLGLDKRVFA
jgi:hypothetical protein